MHGKLKNHLINRKLSTRPFLSISCRVKQLNGFTSVHTLKCIKEVHDCLNNLKPNSAWWLLSYNTGTSLSLYVVFWIEYHGFLKRFKRDINEAFKAMALWKCFIFQSISQILERFM